MKYTLNEYVFESLTKEGAYWLGILAADGYISENKNSITLCLKAEDRKHIQKFISFIDFTGIEKIKWATCNGKKYPNYYVTINSKNLKNILLNYGIVPNKSNKDIDYLKYIPYDLRLYFIFGYLDGDGWLISKKKKGQKECKVEIMGNYTFISSMLEYLRNRFDVNCTIYSQKKNSESKIKYILGLRKYKDLSVFLNLYINENFVLERKKEIAKDIITIVDSYLFEQYNKKENFCKRCGKKINQKSTYCIECSHIIERKVERPSREILKNEIRCYSFLVISKKYGVSDNTVRKWCKYYKLPYLVSEIKSISESDWCLI